MIAERRGVKVIHGANDGVFEVAGYPLTRLREALVVAFNIPEDALALANGKYVPWDYEARQDDVIEFVRERGEKGGRKKAAAATPEDDDENEHHFPDLSAMSLDGLATFIDGRLAASHAAGERALLQAHKSAVALFWAGAALFEARVKCKKEGRGKWTAYKAEHDFAHSTANDAILLFENAKTPDALAGLGITEAKNKFVRPEPTKPTRKPQAEKPTQSTAEQATHPTTSTATAETSKAYKPQTAVEPEEVEPAEDEDEVPDFDPADSIAEALEDIAQQLNEIAQDDLGKVDLAMQVPLRLRNSIRAVTQGIANICQRINHEQPNS